MDNDQGGLASQMTTRDFLASRAIEAAYELDLMEGPSKDDTEFSTEQRIAYNAYRIADAMLKERNRG